MGVFHNLNEIKKMGNYSKLELRRVSESDYQQTASFIIDESCDVESELLLSLEFEDDRIDYFNETQILELYYYLKANLAKKYKDIM